MITGYPEMKYRRNYCNDIIISRSDAHFDRASEAALSLAVGRFGIDDCGHSNSIDWIRSKDAIVVRFTDLYIRTGMSGPSFTYTFDAWTERYDCDGDLLAVGETDPDDD